VTGTDARPSVRVLALPLAVAAGAGLAVQARLNAELAARMGSGIVGPALSLAVGTVILLAMAVALPPMRRGLRRVADEVRSGGLRPWHLIGGVAGAALVITQGLTVGVLGVAVFTVAIVAGQTTSSLAVDRAGLGPGGRRAMTPTRLAGAVLTLVAVLLAVPDGDGATAAIALAVLPLLAGVAVAFQQAVNAHVNAAAGRSGGGLVGSAFPATLVNFTAGTTALALAAAVEIGVRGLPAAPPADWLLYLGGPLGIVFIVTAAALVGRTGVLLFTLAAIGGQLVGAILLDVLVPATPAGPTATTFVAAALALVAVGVAAVPPHRARALARTVRASRR
jgi:transporter family-2 protein